MWTEPIYVVRTDDDSDAICCKDKEETQKAIDSIQAHSLDGGKEIIVEEDFDTVYSIWEHKPEVILLTEKNTGNRLVISTKSIAMLW